MARKTILGTAGLSVILSACGTTSSSTSTTTSVSKPQTGVYTILTSKTAQMVQSGQDATFTLTALSKSGAPVPQAPVSFYLGTMVPLSGIGVKTWVKSGTTAASPYVVSASARTDSAGKATLILKGQPVNTMEMIGVSVGTLSTFSQTKGAIGSMDAWWTSPGTSPTAPIGDYVTVSPFATVASSSSQHLSILVSSPSGPVPGASVTVTPKTSMSSGMGSPATSPMSYSTSSNGMVSTDVMASSTTPFRIVATMKGSTSRIAGGMNIFVEK